MVLLFKVLLNHTSLLINSIAFITKPMTPCLSGKTPACLSITPFIWLFWSGLIHSNNLLTLVISLKLKLSGVERQSRKIYLLINFVSLCLRLNDFQLHSNCFLLLIIWFEHISRYTLDPFRMSSNFTMELVSHYFFL